MANMAFLAPALMAGAATCAVAQDAPAGAAQDSERATTPGSPPPVVLEARLADRIINLETNREMIAAEAPTDIVISGIAIARCGLVVDFGDGTRLDSVVSESSPFPLRLAHTYPKTADVVVRVVGAGDGSAPPCEGEVETAVHISPAGSKIEYITLSTGCPEGWVLKGEINADKSFRCAPIPDASAPTNLIHCIDGMKYFAYDGHVGCRHPQLAGLVPENFPKATTPVAKGKARGRASGAMAKAKTPAMPKAQRKIPVERSAMRKAQPRVKSTEASN